jgi:hypothetical protein
MNALARTWLVRVCQIAIGLVFVAAALPKIGDPASFAKSVHNFRVLPVSLENLAAVTLPWIELVAGLVAVLNPRAEMLRPWGAGGTLARSGATVTAGLMVVFTLAVAQAVVRDLDIACGCFGTADATQVGVTKLLENLALTAVAIVAAVRARV